MSRNLLMKLYSSTREEIKNPTQDDLENAFNEIGALEGITAFHLFRTSQILTVIYISDDRVSLIFRDNYPVKRVGTLLDLAYSVNDGEIKVKYGSLDESVALFRTISKDKAKSVVEHYFLNQGFPPNCRWEGNV